MNPLNPLYEAVAWVMTQIHTGLGLVISPGSGLAWVLTIVILVVAMRLILVPLFVKQMHATRKMAALAPQLQELRKKYKNDKQKLNEETMALYKANGANPLAGCLPLIAQMPLFFALFSVLRAISEWKPGKTSYGMPASTVLSAQHANILGANISDKVLFTHGMYVPMHAKIVILCAVAISVATTFMTVRQSTKRGMNPQTMTPDNPMASTQKYMAYVVPLFALSGLYWQFGLVLYWVTTNVWTLGQQYVLFRRYPTPAAAGAADADAKAGATAKTTAAAKSGGPAKTGAAGRNGAAAKSAAAARAGGAPKTGAVPATWASRKAASAGGSRGGAAAGNGAPASGPGMLSRLARLRGGPEPEPEPPPAEPETKTVRHQPQRQSRSKRSGKR